MGTYCIHSLRVCLDSDPQLQNVGNTDRLKCSLPHSLRNSTNRIVYRKDRTCLTGLIWDSDWSDGLTQGQGLITHGKTINNIYILLTM